MFGSAMVSFAQGPGAGWRFSRTVTLSTPTTLANYQVKVTLTTGLLGNPYTDINSDGSDLRFYDNSNNLCSYWIESFSNTGTSTIWVKVVSSAASSIIMYYGNASATAVSNGTNTFDFFDDFLGASLAPNWSHDTSAGNTYAVSGGQIALNNNTTNAASSVSISSAFTPASPSFFLETKNKEVGYHRNRFYATTSLNGRSPLAFDYGYFTTQATSQTTSKIFYNGFSATSPLSNNTYYLTRWKITDGSTYNWSTLNYSTGASIDARTATLAAHIRYVSILVTEAGSTSTIVDWVRVRKSQATDPTTTVGAQLPLNDNCTNAFSITPAPVCTAISGSNVGATSSAGLPSQSCTPTGNSKDVWYSFTADGVSTYRISVRPNSGRWSAVVYNGACGSLTTAACAEGANGGNVTLNAGILSAGLHYYRTYARNGVSNGFTTCVVFVSPPDLTSLGSSNGCPGTSITINGTNLSAATAVTIGGTPVTSITSNSATQIVAIIGNGTTGNVVVTTAGGTSNGLPFTVNSAAPAGLTYTSNPVSYCQGSSITANSPSTSGGGTPASYSVSPALPAGLSLNTSTGIITGNPTEAAGVYPVTVTASNSCGSANVNLNITIISNTWTGVTSSDWNDGTNWSCGVPPDATNNVTIPSGTPHDPIVSTAIATANNIIIASGASVTVTGDTLQIAGSITNNGIFDVGDGAIELNGTSPQAIPTNVFASNTIKDLIISNDISLDGVDSLTGTLSFGGSDKTFNTNGNLILKSTISGTASVGQIINGNNITGDVTVERYIATGTGSAPNHGKSWQFLAVPTSGPQTINLAWQEGCDANINCLPHFGTQITGSGGTAAGFDVFTSTPSMKTYNYLTNDYDGVAGTQIPIYNKKGYFVFVRGDRSVVSSTAPAVPTVLRTRGTLFTPANLPPIDTVIAGKFESIGNPYASVLDMRQIIRTGGVDEFFQVWDPRLGGGSNFGAFQTFFKSGTDYMVSPGGGSYGPFGTVNNYIQSGQAFLVQATGSDGTVSFAESSKANVSSTLFSRPGSAPRMQQLLQTVLNEVNSDGSTAIIDGVLNSFDDSYSNAVDALDAKKTFSNGENLSISTGGKLLVIERKHTITQKDTIFLNLTGVRFQSYQFRFNASNIHTGVEGFLEDNYLHNRTPINLTGSTVVNFSIVNIAGSYAPDRFRIVFAPAAMALPVTFASVKAYRQDKNINVEWTVENEMNMKQYEVEKSTNGIQFTTLNVKAVTASDRRTGIYVMPDTRPAEGYNYYRIKSVDINKKATYSNVVKVLMGGMEHDITISPNPITDGMIHLQLMNQPEGKYNIRLLNNLAVIVSKQINHIGGSSTELINTDYHLAHGIYQLEVTKPGGSLKDINVTY